MLALPDYTWCLETMEIPDTTPQSKVNDVAIAALSKRLNEGNVETSFIGVYSVQKE